MPRTGQLESKSSNNIRISRDFAETTVDGKTPLTFAESGIKTRSELPKGHPEKNSPVGMFEL